MPEDKDDPTSSVTPPADHAKLRPTVIPSPGAVPRKTKSREGRPRAESANTSTPSTPAVGQPTAIPGVERRRIAVTTSELKALSPGAAPAVYERALELLGTFVVEKATERKAILWGHDVQKAYGDLVTQTLALSQSPLLRKVDGYLSRMMDILGSIDLMAVCGHGSGGFAQLFKPVTRKIDTPGELRAAQAELDQLVRYLDSSLRELLDLKDKLEEHAGRINAIGVEVEAAALAALFLSRHVQKASGGLAQCFMERSMSLTQTLAQIRTGDSMREIQIEQPIRMVRVVQNVALVMMPGFLGSVAAALTLADRKSLTPTQAGELTYQLRDILRALQT